MHESTDAYAMGRRLDLRRVPVPQAPDATRGWAYPDCGRQGR
jgi:hypothetical protein